MYFIPELAPQSIVCDEPRIFFTIEYTDSDCAFARAADTWRRMAPGAAGFDPTKDEILSWKVLWEKDFRNVWSLVETACRARKAKAFMGALFTHASKSGGTNGLEFRRNATDDGTLNSDEIGALEPLPWHEAGTLVLTGCNTGNTGKRGWCPAAAFAARQQVRTLGQVGYAYFSSSWDKYQKINAKDGSICLWAFGHGKNGIWRDGTRLQGRVF